MPLLLGNRPVMAGQRQRYASRNSPFDPPVDSISTGIFPVPAALHEGYTVRRTSFVV